MKVRHLGKTVLVVVVVLLSGAVWVSFRERVRDSEHLPPIELLSPDVVRRSEGFEHSGFRLGDLRFRVRAASHSQTTDGLENLDDAQLEVFGREGMATDLVRGREAVYDIEGQSVVFRDEVRIVLADGTELFSRQMKANLAAETLEIEEGFRFRRGEAEGSGRALRYRINDLTLEINRDFSLRLESETDSFEVKAVSAFYEMDALRVDLQGSARISSSSNILSADQMQVFLRSDQSIEKVFANQSAKLEMDVVTFTGVRIELVSGEMGEGIQDLVVEGGEPEDSPSIRARLERLWAEGPPDWLEAKRLQVEPGPGGRAASLSHFQAFEGVVFSSPRSGIEEGRAESLDARWNQEGTLRSVTLSRQVGLIRLVPGRKDQVTASRIDLKFDAAEKMESAQAFENVLVVSQAEGLLRQLEAQDSVLVRFAEGEASDLRAMGDCRLVSQETSSRSVIRAPEIRAAIEKGEIKRVSSSPGVALELSQGGEVRESSSQRLDVNYEKGRLVRAAQSGDVVLRGRFGDGAATIRGDQAVLDEQSGKIRVLPAPGRKVVVEQPASAQGSSTMTQANLVTLDRSGGGFAASGQVRTEQATDSGALVIEAGDLKRDNGSPWIIYENQPLLVMGGNRVRGPRMRFHQQDETLEVDGGVETLWKGRADDQAEERTYSVSAQSMVYRRQESRAVYEGMVELKSEDAVVHSTNLELKFEGNGMDNLTEVVARGQVVVTQPKREARGDEAVYDPSEGKVTLTGQPATILDAEQGKAEGRVLVFWLNDDRISVRGPGQP